MEESVRSSAPTSTPTGRHLVPPALVMGAAPLHRPRAEGKFLFLNGEKMWIRGVTYGTFRPNGDGQPYPQPSVVDQDFAAMASHGINSVRTYTIPPRWLLDTARRHGHSVMVGLPWEQHITFLDEKRRTRLIEERVREGVRACAGHPAVLAYTIGNEIPAPIVRWYGRRRIERWLEQLYRVTKSEDPHSLVTYVNYPTTEYLQLPFLDFVCFNVYLESQDRLRAYLSRLHNVAGDRPLLLAEVGLDSQRHGELGQAKVLDWQIRSAFAAGCAGAFLFAWTDEWHRGGHDIEDWHFGLTTRDRRPKPALASVEKALQDTPLPATLDAPRISVIVCCYNEARVIRDCLEGLRKVVYPNFEVIVVDDGSTDATASIAGEYDVRVLSTPNRGLSSARNTGIEAATGEIVAFIDGDAYPDPHWLTYLAAMFANTRHAGIGGPNLPPRGDGWIADCVANAPGNPTHVLITDEVAEHIPGCNMAFRKDALEAISGFDIRFRSAGDDVDVCWRLQQKGETLGFHPSAMVWHHRRNTMGAYWRQQKGYGRAEALLAQKWPEKYNPAGHYKWSGRLYATGVTRPLAWRPARVYQGTWGSAFFQALYDPSPNRISSLMLMPEWYLVVLALAGIAALGFLWSPLLAALPLLGVAVLLPAVQACLSAAKASGNVGGHSRWYWWRCYAATVLLHVLQPLARLRGRVDGGLTPWRCRMLCHPRLPCRRTVSFWSEHWRSPTDRLKSLEASVQRQGFFAKRGGDYDTWDLQVWGGLLAASRLCMTVEEHGSGKQLVRFRVWPKLSASALSVIVLFLILCAWAGLDQALAASAILGGTALLLVARMFHESVCAISSVVAALEESQKRES